VAFQGLSSMELDRVFMDYNRAFFPVRHPPSHIATATTAPLRLTYVSLRSAGRSGLTVRPVDNKCNLNRRGNVLHIQVCCCVLSLMLSCQTTFLHVNGLRKIFVIIFWRVDNVL
jgi:hypothetical protein